MASCEKCWSDAWGDASEYQKLIEERKDNPCSPEEQAGIEAKECNNCKRKTVHQYTKKCVVCNK